MDDSKNKNQKQNQQPQPIPPQPGIPYQMPPKKKMSKGAIWGIIGGSIGLIILIVGIVLAVIFLGGPSKADYKDLVSQINDFNNDTLRDIRGSSNLKDSINKSIERIDERHKKIETHKALRDKELKDAYDKYVNTWNKDTKPYFQALAYISDKRPEFTSKCLRRNQIKYLNSTKDEVEKNFDSVMKDCMDLVDETAKSSNKMIAKYGEDLRAYFNDIKKYYVEMAEYIKTRNPSSRPKLPKSPMLTGGNDTAKELRNNYDSFKKLLEQKANS